MVFNLIVLEKLVNIANKSNSTQKKLKLCRILQTKSSKIVEIVTGSIRNFPKYSKTVEIVPGSIRNFPKYYTPRSSKRAEIVPGSIRNSPKYYRPRN